ncbi:hypothetical protein QUF80_09150 [Desulfococcaceae bacterium HSG8]|nr:hypothetical protein [Desulfococcaceae bacterium HSG8]
MGLYVVVFCGLLLILVSAIHQWKLLLLLAFLFIVTAGTLLWYSNFEREKRRGNALPEKEIETVRIFYGSEKRGLLKDPQFQEILRKKHGVVINGDRTDGLEMPEDLEEIDAFWPSNGLVASLFKKQFPDVSYEMNNIFSTPVVLYSWPNITEALIKAGVVEKRKKLYIISDMKKLLEMRKQTWESLRLIRQTGPVVIQSADPSKSSPGLLMAVLTVVSLNNGKMAKASEIDKYKPDIIEIYKYMGALKSSSDILFNRYIRQGQGTFPLISACENQLIEFYQTSPDYQEKIRNQIRMLIPEPTVLNEHPLIALTEKGKMLLEALGDPDIRKLAWRKHGFRSGESDIDDPLILEGVSLPEQIAPLIPLPSPEIAEDILSASDSKSS